VARRRAPVTLALILLMAGCNPSPSATPSPAAIPFVSPSAPVTAAPSGSPVAVARTAGGTWEVRLLTFEPVGLAGFEGFGGVATTHAGLIGWGLRRLSKAASGMRAGSGSELMIVTAGDTRWSGDSVLEGDRIAAVAEGPAGIVAVGTDATGAARAWHLSADDPSKVALLGVLPGSPQALAVSADRYLAVGAVPHGCGLAAWSSVTGKSWAAAASLPIPAGACDARVNALIATPAILLASGTVPGTGPVTWTSTDGTSWQLHPQPALAGAILGVAAGGPGFVAVGTARSSGTTSAGVWTSADGATWEPVAGQPSLASARMVGVARLASGTLVAAGNSVGADGADGAFAAWTSSDGLTWTRSADVFCDAQTWPCPLGGKPGFVAALGDSVTALGGLEAWESPLRPELHRASLAVSHGGPAITVDGQCTDQTSDAGAPTVDVYAFWREPADAGITSPYATYGGGGREVDIQVTADGRLGNFRYEDPLGRQYEAPGDMFGNSLSAIVVAPGSTGLQGSVTFRNLLGWIPTESGGQRRDGPPLSGSAAWECQP